MSSVSFATQLSTGLIGESHVARWLNRGGWHVLPAYEKELNSGKGPRFYTATRGPLVTPDMLIIRDTDIRWVECKAKNAFAWHRNSEAWTTGIDHHHWEQYLLVRETVPFPLWLFFIQKRGVAKDTPEGMVSPSGLFGQEILILKDCVDHEWFWPGGKGMVYWKIDSLKKLAELDNVVPPCREVVRA